MNNRSVLFVEPGKPEPMFDSSSSWGIPEPFTERMPTFCAYADCSEKSTYRDTPLCRAHAAIVWRLFEMREPATHHEMVREQYKEAQKARVEAAQTTRLNSKRPGYVYYLQVGDRIKIGFTAFMEDRMRAYPPNSKLLAVHPGTMELEKATHSRFKLSLADGREWFHPSEKLTEHIADVNRRYPMAQEERVPLAPRSYPKPDRSRAPKAILVV